jgi:UDP-galactopyranose mutase
LNCFVQGFNPDKRIVETTDGPFTVDVMVNSIHVDALFGFEHGRLQFRGRQFIPLWLPVEFALPEDVTWIHYSGGEEHTRVTEFKKFTGRKSESTLLRVEVPSARGRHYLVPSSPEKERFAKYQNDFPADFSSTDRLGKFSYQGMPEAVRDAIDVAAML